jgi:hypothetical protein
MHWRLCKAVTVAQNLQQRHQLGSRTMLQQQLPRLVPCQHTTTYHTQQQGMSWASRQKQQQQLRLISSSYSRMARMIQQQQQQHAVIMVLASTPCWNTQLPTCSSTPAHYKG